MNEYLAKFRLDALKVKEFDHWLISVRTKQVTLGDTVLLLKRPESSLGSLLGEEAGELPIVVRWFERSATQLFSAEKFNYIAAMMKDPIIHFHALPRYSGERTFAGRQWLDPFWPKAATLEDVTTPERDLEAILKAFREAEV